MVWSFPKIHPNLGIQTTQKLCEFICYDQSALPCPHRQPTSVLNQVEPKSATTTRTLAAADFVLRISHSPVPSTQPLVLESGSHHFALQMAVAVKVSGRDEIVTVNIFTGVVTSPNYPDTAPHNLERREKIQVEVGKVLRLEFTYFNLLNFLCGGIVELSPPSPSTCVCDFVKIMDGDGAILLDKSCGSSSLDVKCCKL